MLLAAAAPAYATTAAELAEQADELAAEAAQAQGAADAAAEARSAVEAELDAANARLWDIIAELEEAEAALLRTMDEVDATTAQIGELEGQVETTKAELAEAQDLMGRRMAASYKGGGRTLIEMVLGSASFEEFVNNLYLASKITEADARAVQDVKDLKASLEQQQAQLEEVLAEKEQLLARQQEEQVALEAKEAAQRDYVDGLDADVREALLAEQAAQEEASRAAAAEATARAEAEDAARAEAEAEAARKAAEEAARKAAEEAAARAEEAARQEAEAASAGQESQAAGEQAAPEPSFEDTGERSGHGRLTDAQRDIIIATAWDRLNAGCRYRSTWGGPDYFGCAGFTQYCYAAAGVDLPRSPDWQQELFTMCPASELLPGDLVFWYNHVAIYAGDGMIIEATSYTGGIRYIANYANTGNLYYYGGGYLP